nr:uncharacterized protein LOC115257838 [Aedes albopictus]
MDGNKAFSNLPPFTFAGVELTDRRQKWNIWKRGFEICLRAAKISDANEKKDMLLAKGGFELQEIFFNIPEADVSEDKEQHIDPYEVAISKLDDYFAPQRHEVHERYIFWAMKPEQGETLSKFMMRTQIHANKCNFGKSASESAEKAVVDKTLQYAPAHLREKLLQVSDLTLEEAIKQVNVYETSQAANDQISGQSVVHQPVKTEYVQRVGTQCRFCGRSHGPQQVCPAWNRSCSFCGKRGHFQAVCFDKPSGSGVTPPGNATKIVPKRPMVPSRVPFNIKRSHDQNLSAPTKPNAKYPRNRPVHRQVNAIEDSSSMDEDPIEYVEMVWSEKERDELLWAEVGGVLIEMQIDSGVQSNIIDDGTWRMMTRNGVQTIGELQRADRKFKAYAQKDCLEVAHMFEAEIIILDKHKELKAVARFYVVKDGPQPLLGKRTAIELGVLIVGLKKHGHV